MLTRGSIFALQGKHTESIESYEQALEYAEDKDEVYYNIGLAYQHSEQYSLAIEAYKNAVEFNIDHEGALYELAYCLDVSGQLESSVSYYKRNLLTKIRIQLQPDITSVLFITNSGNTMKL